MMDVSGLRIQGSKFGVQASGIGVQGSGFRVRDLGFKVQGSGFRVQGSGSRVQGSGFRVQASGCTHFNRLRHRGNSGFACPSHFAHRTRFRLFFSHSKC